MTTTGHLPQWKNEMNYLVTHHFDNETRNHVTITTKPVKVMEKDIYMSPTMVHPDYTIISLDIMENLYSHDWVVDVANRYLFSKKKKKYKLFYFSHIDLYHILIALSPEESTRFESFESYLEYNRNEAIEYVETYFGCSYGDDEDIDRMIDELRNLDLMEEFCRVNDIRN